MASLVEEVFDSVPEKLSPAERAHLLVERLDDIGTEALERGFQLDAYPPRPDFYSETVWEGGEFPLSLIVFVWPPEEWALSQSAESQYRTCIHGHPMLCSLTVLSGTVIQESFELEDPLTRQVSLVEKEQLVQGDLVIDEENFPFVHCIYCTDTGASPAITLHGYGAGSREAISQAYRDHPELTDYVETHAVTANTSAR